MKIFGRAPGFSVLCTMLLTGCAAPPQHIVDHEFAGRAIMRDSPVEGFCTLYARNSTRIESTTVNLGDPIGFTLLDGQLVAVAGKERIALAEGGYSWIWETERRAVPLRHVLPLSFTPSPPHSAGDLLWDVVWAPLIWLANNVPFIDEARPTTWR